MTGMGTFIHTRISPTPELEYNAFCQCADERRGNFYDFISRDSGSLFVSVGDLPSDGGSPIVTVPCLQTLIRGLTAGSPDDLAEVARELNSMLHLLGPKDLFVPWFFARIDPLRQELRYVNAGHESALLVRPRDGTAERLEHTGAALALSTRSHVRERTKGMDPGDVLVVFSEGVAAALPDAQLLDLVLCNLDVSAAELTRRVLESADGTSRRSWLDEDRTFASVRYHAACQRPLVHDAEQLLVCAA